MATKILKQKYRNRKPAPALMREALFSGASVLWMMAGGGLHPQLHAPHLEQLALTLWREFLILELKAQKWGRQ